MHLRQPNPRSRTQPIRRFLTAFNSKTFGHRWRLSLPRILLLLGPLLLAVGCRESNQSNGVTFLPSSPSPTPNLGFELRFGENMVPISQVGTPGEAPLQISPALPGTFTWTSPRSGIFSPAEPLRLDTSYRFTLRPGLRCADGKRSRAGLRWTIKTPPLTLIGSYPNGYYAGSTPHISLAFNAAVDPATAEPFLFFTDALRRRIPVDLIPETESTLDPSWLRESWLSWQERFPSQNGASAPGVSSTNLVANVLRVSPRRPLPSGTNWQLIIQPGLPARSPRLKLREQVDLFIGDILPFTLSEVTAQHYLYEGPHISLRFTKSLAESINDQLDDWISVAPRPNQLRGEVFDSWLKLSGDFQSGTFYQVTIHGDLPALEGCPYSGSNVVQVIMPEVPPRLYFPAFSNDQWANGRRSFPMISVNLPQVWLRAKWLPPETAIHALRGFDGYYRNDNYSDPDEIYRELDFNLIPGQTVFEGALSNALVRDVAQTNQLDWNQLIQNRTYGVVFLDARGQPSRHPSDAPGAQALIQLSDLGLVWKQSPRQISLFAFSCDTGQPLGAIETQLRSAENELLQRGATDQDGLVQFSADSKAAWVSLQKREDFHAIPLQPDGSLGYKPGSQAADPEDSRRLLIVSDRNLYRPGETIHLQLLSRQWNEQNLEIPSNLNGRLYLDDPRGQRCFETNLVFDTRGSCAIDLSVPAMRRGEHLVGFEWDKQTYYHSFQVQDFKPDVFEVRLQTQPAYAAEQRIEIPVDARYLGGDPLSRAQVKWFLSGVPTEFKSDRFPDFSFGTAAYERRGSQPPASISLNGEALLGGTSNLVVSPRVPFNSTAPDPLVASFIAEVTDLNQQTVLRRAEFVRHASQFYLGLKNPKSLRGAGEAVALEAVAVDTEGKPWTNSVQARLRLQQMHWQNVRVQGAGRTVRYHNELWLSNVFEQAIPLQPTASRGETQSVQPVALPVFSGLQPANYLVQLSAQDPAGRPVVTALEFAVSAQSEAHWAYRNEHQLKLIPDRPVYEPGQAARILVEAPFSGTALVTVEREKVLRSQVVQLRGNAPSITVPIAPDDGPNIFVSVTLLRGARESGSEFPAPSHRSGSCELAIAGLGHRLNLRVTPENAEYRPGHNVELTVQADDHRGQPVSGAAVTLYAVDEGVLNLSDYTAPDPFAFFHGSRRLRVQTGISLQRLLPEDPAEFCFANKGFLGGGGGKGECAVRQNFQSCCYWNTLLVTDADGKVRARFRAPDNLTRYRVFAFAHADASRFGSAQQQFQVSKPLVIEPALPSFAILNDRLDARAVIQNRSDQPGEVTVRLELDGKAKPAGAGPLARTLTIPARKATVVEFPLTLVDLGTAQWTWRVQSADAAPRDFRDAVQSTLQVRHPLPLLRQVMLKQTTELETELLTGADPQLLAGQGALEVTLSNTRLSELREAAAQLLHYPYGCAEQTSSSLLPWIVLRDKTNLLTSLARSTNSMEEAIAAGVTRLFSMQTAAGGLGYWPGASDPMLFASAYGGLVLTLAQRHGARLPSGDFERLLKFLGTQLRSVDIQQSASESCLALYTLAAAGRAEPAYHERFFSQRHLLSPENRYLLALAIAENRGRADMIDELLRLPAPPLSNPTSHFGSEARTQALLLLARIAQGRLSHVAEAVDELMNLQQDGHWANTQADAWALLALTEYARQIEVQQLPAAGRLSWENQPVPFQLDARTHTVTIPFSYSNRLGSKLLLHNVSRAPLFATVTISARPPGFSHPSLARGFNVERHYYRLDDGNQPQELETLRVGDRVLVSLNVSAHRDSAYVVIDDPLPSILEPINPSFPSRAGLWPDSSREGRRWLGNFHELRADRFLSFADRLPAGHYTLRYVARVRAAGVVTAPGTKVEEMYHPERHGVSATTTLTSHNLN